MNLDDFPGWTTRFDLLHRLEIGGRFVAPLGRPLWNLSAISKSMPPNQLDEWRGRLASLSGSLGTFHGYSLSRCYPQAHPNGNWTGPFEGVVGTVTGPKSLTVDDAPSDFVWTIGDLFEVTGSGVYRVTSVTSGDSLTVVPPIAGDIEGQAIVVVKPGVPMLIVPGSVTSESGRNGWGTVSFSALEFRQDVIEALSFLLLEDGDYILWEDGGRIVLA